MRNGPKPDTTPVEVPDLRVTSSLSEMERRILDYMVVYLKTNTYQPSIREIGEEFGIKSTKTVSEHLQALADKGFLERDPSRSRGVRIVGMDLNAQTFSAPCYRDLGEMDRTIASDDVSQFVSLDRSMAAGTGCFTVTAPAGKLAAAGIAEGDLLVVEPVSGSQLEDGDVVVARMPSGLDYVKVHKEGSRLFLHPLPGEGAPVAIDDPSSLGQVGRVSGFYRRISPLPEASAPTTH